MYKTKKQRIALITGITGQDGSYLTEFLLNHKEFEYTVHGIIRRSSNFNTQRIDHIKSSRLFLHYGDLTDSTNISSIITQTKPDEVYNLAAQSHVKVSFEMPEYTADVDAIGTLRLLDAIKTSGLPTRFYQASTSELYGGIYTTAQNEETPFYPRSPYAISKLFSYWTVINYREAYGIFACNGILFNHESPRRGATFVTKKITRAVANIKKGLQTEIHLGNLNALRDWGHAKDYVVGMWMMLQQDEPDDFVLASGEQYTVRQFVEKAFLKIGKIITWSGTNENEIGKDQDGIVRIMVDPRYYRPSEVENLLGDSNKAKQTLGWKREISFDSMIDEMVEWDLKHT